MHILISVFFNATHGGLHENVQSTARSLLSSGHKVTVVCKPGCFAHKLRGFGANIIETDFSLAGFSSIIETIEKLHSYQPITLIHSHPFLSREVAVIVSQLLGLPIVTTVHGRYLDGLPENSMDYDKIITVSDGIGQYLLDNGLKEPEKLFTSPNTPDKSLFCQTRDLGTASIDKAPVIVALFSRLDADKQFVMDIFCKAVEYADVEFASKIHWLIVGQGDRKRELEEKIEKLSDSNTYEFSGWLTGNDLLQAYLKCDIAIVPGRCALEAMACGVATIALGSKGYTGIIGPENWQKGAYSNFGGLGNMEKSYKDGAVEADLEHLMMSASIRNDYGQFGKSVVELFFDEKEVNKKLFNLYELIRKSWLIHPKQMAKKSDFLELQIQNVKAERIADNQIFIECICANAEKLQFAWYVRHNNEIIEKLMYTDSPNVLLTLELEGSYSFQCYVKNHEEDKLSFYIAECRLLDGKVCELQVVSTEAKLTPLRSIDVSKRNIKGDSEIRSKLKFDL